MVLLDGILRHGRYRCLCGCWSFNDWLVGGQSCVSFSVLGDEDMIIIIEIMLAMIACMVLAGVILFVARMIGTLWGKKDG